MSSPLRSGMLMSSMSRSHVFRCRHVSVSFPVAASPMSTEDSDCSRNCRSPARNRVWSSAIRTRVIGDGPPLGLAREAGIPVELVIQRLDAAPQDVRGAPLVAGEVIQRGLDDRTFD